MDLRSAEILAKSLMLQHGMTDWTFRFDHARRRFGLCSTTRKLISLSAHLVRLNDEPEVRDTILHEIAHALTPGDGHGQEWKAACRRIGAKPERTFDEGDGVQVPASRLRVGCERCDWWAPRQRISWRLAVCRKCRTPVTWEHVGTRHRYRIQQEGRRFLAVRI
jgi:predicted SprT family Zn-dependent metalloprotease